MNTVTAPVAATLAKIHALPAVGAAMLHKLHGIATAPLGSLKNIALSATLASAALGSGFVAPHPVNAAPNTIAASAVPNVSATLPASVQRFLAKDAQTLSPEGLAVEKELLAHKDFNLDTSVRTKAAYEKAVPADRARALAFFKQWESSIGKYLAEHPENKKNTLCLGLSKILSFSTEFADRQAFVKAPQGAYGSAYTFGEMFQSLNKYTPNVADALFTPVEKTASLAIDSDIEKINTAARERNAPALAAAIKADEEATKKLAEAEKENAEATRRLADANRENTAARQENTAARQENTAARQENTAARQENTAARQENTAARQENTAAHARNADLTARLATAQRIAGR